MIRQKRKLLSSIEVSLYCEQIAIILNGGIPLYEGTCMMYEEMEEARLKTILSEIDEQVKQNVPLYDALKKTEAFPEYMIQMVRIGETTGKLEEVMRSLAEYYEREHNVKMSIKNVVTYPLVLFAMMGVILLVLVVKILPMFQSVFYELEGNVSSSSSNMMNTSIMIGEIIAGLIFACAILIILVVMIYHTKQGKQQIKKMTYYFPGFSRSANIVAKGQFMNALAIMITSGMESEEALHLVLPLVQHPQLKKKVEECTTLVKQQESLEDSLKETKLVTGMDGRMLGVGGKTGVLDLVMTKLSNKYDNEITDVLCGISNVIETILIITLSVLVGSVLVSVMLPLVSIISSIG